MLLLCVNTHIWKENDQNIHWPKTQHTPTYRVGGEKNMDGTKNSPFLCRLDVDGVHDALDFFCDLLGPDSVLLKLCFHCWLRDTLLRGHNTQVTVTAIRGGCCWIGRVNAHTTRDLQEDKIDTCCFNIREGKKWKHRCENDSSSVCISRSQSPKYWKVTVMCWWSHSKMIKIHHMNVIKNASERK